MSLLGLSESYLVGDQDEVAIFMKDDFHDEALFKLHEPEITDITMTAPSAPKVDYRIFDGGTFSTTSRPVEVQVTFKTMNWEELIGSDLKDELPGVKETDDMSVEEMLDIVNERLDNG